VLMAGLALAGCGQPQRPTIQESGTTTPEEPTAQALHAILSRRAQALTAGDEKAFLADLDQSNRKLIEQQQLVFANLRQFKLKAFKYLSPEIVATNQDGDVYRFEPIHEVVQLTADDGPGGVSPAGSFRYSVTRRDGKLLIVEILPYTRANAKQFDLDGLAADAPWYLTRLTVRHAGTVCLAADRSVTDLDHYAAVAQAELRYVEGLWGDRLQFPGQVLFFTGDEENFRRWFSFGEASNYKPIIEGFAAAQNGVRQNGEVYGEQYAGSRIVVNTRRINQFGDDPRSVIRHELAHSVTARATAVADGWGRAPTWAVEGFATWTGNRDRRSEVARGIAAGKFRDTLPETDDFYGKDIAFNYALSESVFRYVERVKGRAAAVEFYARVIPSPDDTNFLGPGSLLLDTVCKRVVGVSGETFLRQWSSFVRSGA
jgi:hypothetical protein